MKVTIGEKVDGGTVTLNVESLIYSRALIQANSGGGKSGLMRVIAEQVAAKIPTIIIDKEGEYHTLREKLDIVLVGERGEIAANVRSAGLLARKLVELGASAVCDLYELKLPQQREWVKNFVESLMSLPKNLWHPTLVLIDECDVFAPEKGFGESTATDAVIDLMARGRKHGLCGIPATQRLSKLHKNIAAEVNNVFIGRTWLDTDQSRAGKMLGLSSSGALILRDFKTREFQAFGPALETNGVIHFRVADCETTIPKPGDRAALTPPKASHVVTEIAKKLKDLPQQAEAEIKSLADSQAKVRELEREIRTLKRSAPIQTIEKPVERIVEKPVIKDAQITRLEAFGEKLSTVGTQLVEVAREITEAIKKTSANGHKADPALPRSVLRQRSSQVHRSLPERKAAPSLRVEAEPQAVGDLKLNKTQQRILDALAWYESIGNVEPTNTQIGAVALIDSTGGYFGNTVGPLVTAGLVERGSGRMRLTDAGRSVASVPENIGSLDEYHEVLRQRVRRARSASNRTVDILNVIIEAGGDSLTNAEIGERVGIDHTGGYFGNTIGPLTTLGLVERNQGTVRPTEVLFPPGIN